MKKFTEKEFKQALLGQTLPKEYVVTESVTIKEIDLDHLMTIRIINGIFSKELYIADIPKNCDGIEIIDCVFQEDVGVHNCIIKNNMIIKDSTFSFLRILLCNLEKNLVMTDSALKNFSITATSCQDYFVDDYRVAQVISLAKQGIYINLDKIPI